MPHIAQSAPAITTDSLVKTSTQPPTSHASTTAPLVMPILQVSVAQVLALYAEPIASLVLILPPAPTASLLTMLF